MSANTTQAIDYLADTISATLSASMLFLILAGIPVILTVALVVSRRAEMGYPCAIFWAIFGGYCYMEATTKDWGNIYYYLFFASLFGMVIFTIYVAFGLRERRDTLADEGMEEEEKGEADFTGEEEEEEEKSEVSERTRGIRERAKKRKSDIG